MLQAMHLVYRALEKDPVPDKLPPTLVPPNKRRKGGALAGAVPVLPGPPPVLPAAPAIPGPPSVSLPGRNSPATRRASVSACPLLMWASCSAQNLPCLEENALCFLKTERWCLVTCAKRQVVFYFHLKNCSVDLCSWTHSSQRPWTKLSPWFLSKQVIFVNLMDLFHRAAAAGSQPGWSHLQNKTDTTKCSRQLIWTKTASWTE